MAMTAPVSYGLGESGLAVSDAGAVWRLGPSLPTRVTLFNTTADDCYFVIGAVITGVSISPASGLPDGVESSTADQTSLSTAQALARGTLLPGNGSIEIVLERGVKSRFISFITATGVTTTVKGGPTGLGVGY